MKRVPVKGFEDLYEVDTQGNVFSVKNGILKPHIKNGYLAVNLYKNRKLKHFYIHRLIAEAFIPNQNNLPEVNHIDCNKQNNSVENLEWCDRKHNLIHSYSNGLKRIGESHGCHKLTEQEVIQIRSEYVKGDSQHSLHTLAEKYNVNWCTIHAIVTRRTWSHLEGGDVKCPR